MNEIAVDMYCASPDVIYVGTAGSYGNERLKINLSDDYAGMLVHVEFENSNPVIVDADGIVDLPWEATATAGMYLAKVVGYRNGQKISTVPITYYVRETLPDNQGTPPGPAKSLAEQLIDAASAAITQAGQYAADAEQSAESAAESAEEAAASVVGAVRYDTEQGLTEEEKAQARENIGAGSGSGLPIVTEGDNGKFLRVVNGAWAADSVPTYQGGSY